MTSQITCFLYLTSTSSLWPVRLHVSSISQARRLYDQSDYMFPLSHKHNFSMASQITCFLYLKSTSFLWPVRLHVSSISQTPRLYGQADYMFPLSHMKIVSMTITEIIYVSSTS